MQTNRIVPVIEYNQPIGNEDKKLVRMCNVNLEGSK